MKVKVGLKIGTYKSVGASKLSSYTFTERPLTLNYYTRQRYRNFYYDMMLSARTQVNGRIAVGMEAGFYLNFRETYFSDTAKTHTLFTAWIITSFGLVNAKMFQLGIEAKAGLVFTDVRQANSRMKKGRVFSAGLFYKQKLMVHPSTWELKNKPIA